MFATRRAPALLTALLLCVAATAATGPALADEPAAARIALVLPLSGELESLGEAARDGVEWALGDATHLTVEVHDTGGDPEQAAALVASLAQDPGVVAIVGPVGAEESRAAADEAQRARVPLLTLTSTDGIEHTGDHVFRLRLSPEDQARALARFTVGQLGLVRAAVFYPDHGYGLGCTQAFVEAFVADGGRVTSLESYDPDDSKPDDEAELLVASRARRLVRDDDDPAQTRTKRRRGGRAHVDFDVLFIPDAGNRVARALTFLELAGLPDDGSIQLLGTSAWASGGLAGAEGRARGALVSRLFDPMATEAVEEAAASFADEHGRQPTELEAQAHDGMRLLLHAIARCGTTSARGCIVQGLRSGASVDGVTGTVALTQEGGLRREILLFDVDHDGQMWPTY